MNDATGDAVDGSAGLAAVRDLTAALRDNVQRIIVGKTAAIDQALIALLCGGHALIEDVPGTGKTTLAKAFAASLGCRFKRLQFTPDLVPADVVGVNVFDAASGSFRFQPGPIFSEIVLADEINRATPRTQSALLEAMAERQVTIDGTTTALPAPFIVLATLNPVEMEGTFPLPEAQLDRFLLRFSLGYPTREEESRMLERFGGQTAPAALSAVAGPGEILAAQAAIDRVAVNGMTREYILRIVEATRAHPSLRLGGSPRATLALHKAAQAHAAIDGRDFVLPDDVKALAAAVLAHRIVVETGAELRGAAAEQVVAAILAETPVPIEP